MSNLDKLYALLGSPTTIFKDQNKFTGEICYFWMIVDIDEGYVAKHELNAFVGRKGPNTNNCSVFYICEDK